jgi:hypothetical protein
VSEQLTKANDKVGRFVILSRAFFECVHWFFLLLSASQNDDNLKRLVEPESSSLATKFGRELDGLVDAAKKGDEAKVKENGKTLPTAASKLASQIRADARGNVSSCQNLSKSPGVFFSHISFVFKKALRILFVRSNYCKLPMNSRIFSRTNWIRQIL